MSSAPPSLVFFSEEDIKGLKSQKDRLSLHASSLATAINSAEVRANEAAALLSSLAAAINSAEVQKNEVAAHLKLLQGKYAVSQEYLLHLDSLITKASEENAATIAKILEDDTKAFSSVTTAKWPADDLDIPQVASGDGKSDAPTLIRAVLEMHFSDKVNMDTFANNQSQIESSKEFVVCTVQLKDKPFVFLDIWYNASNNLHIGGRVVVCGNIRNNYTTVKDLKDAITNALSHCKLSSYSKKDELGSPKDNKLESKGE
jgi:hypothetical protein